MNRNSVKNKTLPLWNIIGRIMLVLVAVVIFCGETFAQDETYSYQLSLYPRRLGDQVGVEIWIRSLVPDAPAIGDMTIPIDFNRAYLTPAVPTDRNQPSTITDAVVNNVDLPDPYYTIRSGYSGGNFSTLTAQSGMGLNYQFSALYVRLANASVQGVAPADTGKGTFIGMLRFNINKGVLTDAATADFAFILGSGSITGDSMSIQQSITGKPVVNDLVEFVECPPFTIRGITVLNPTSYQTINRYPAVPYASMGNNYGYPIYFERSGLLDPDTALGVYGTERYAYKIDYSLDGGTGWTETGRIAETRSTDAQLSTDAARNAVYNGQIDYNDAGYYMTTGSGKALPADVELGTQLQNVPDGPGLTTSGYGGVLRVIWKGDENFPYSSENAKVQITLLTGADKDAGTSLVESSRPAIPAINGQSTETFVLGRIFYASLNGDCQYLKSERAMRMSSAMTVAAWVNLNRLTAGSTPGILAASSGTDNGGTIGGAFMLYLVDGQYPAFRVRQKGNAWLADVVSTQALPVYDVRDADGNLIINDGNYTNNWTHVAAVVSSNIVTLYVNGEQVAQTAVPGTASKLDAEINQHIWIGVNPDAEFTIGQHFFGGGIKEAQVWKTDLSQEQLRQYISGVPFPTQSSWDITQDVGYKAVGFQNDPKESLIIYANLQGIISDIATNQDYQDNQNNFKFYDYCGNSTEAVSVTNGTTFRPDGSHIKITSPSCGEGVSNLKGKTYEIRWVSYGIGNSLPTEAGQPGDVTISITRDNGANWFDAIGEQKYDEATGGTFAVSLDNEEAENSVAIWEPYNNVTLTTYENDIQGVFDIEGNYEKTVRIRVSGNAERNQGTIYAESGDFVVAPHFALRNNAESQITIPGSSLLNIATQTAFIEAWIKPYSFPVGEGTSFPIVAKKDPVTGDLHYALRLLSTGALQFEFANYDEATGTRTSVIATSDTSVANTNMIVPPGHTSSEPREYQTWYHVGVHVNFPANGTQSKITFYIDGVPQINDAAKGRPAIQDQLGAGIVSEVRNTFPTYLGYEPNGAEAGTFFDGELREVRFWRNNPGGYAETDQQPLVNGSSVLAKDNFIQGASTIRASELRITETKDYTTGLIAAYSLDGGSWVNNGLDGTLPVYPHRSELVATTSAGCGNAEDPEATTGRRYMATYPYLKLVEPTYGDKISNVATTRVRWVGFDYNRNDLESFTAGTAANTTSGDPAALADLGISERGGAGGGTNDETVLGNKQYPAVASPADNTSFRNAMTLITQSDSYEFQGTASKSQFAASLNLGLANSDVKRNESYDEQGPVNPTQGEGRLRLIGRTNINSPDPLEYRNVTIKDGVETVTLIRTLMTEGPLFSITPPSNFTARVLLEGYHKGLDTGIVGQLGTENGGGFENNALRISFFTDTAGYQFVPTSATVSAASYDILGGATSGANRNAGTRNFANVPFTLTTVLDGQYFVVVDNLNYLPIASAFKANFRYNGDLDSTWGIESGWDFSSWDGSTAKMTQADADANNPAGKFAVYMDEVPTANYASSSHTWTLTPLNFNTGYGRRYVEDGLNQLPAMVGGDINRDGTINTQDFQLIRDAGSMSNSPQYRLRGVGQIANAIDRTIVDNNIGKRTALFEMDDAIMEQIYGWTEEEIVTGRIEAQRLDEEVKANAAFVEQVLSDKKAKLQASFESDEQIEYNVSAIATLNGDYVDVDIYIENLGADWAMANCSYPIKYDPSLLSFDKLYHKRNVIFSNGSPDRDADISNENSFTDAGYHTSYYAPNKATATPIDETYSIEINFDARPASGKQGTNLSTAGPGEIYLGTLRFNMLRKDQSLFFYWQDSYIAILDVLGRDLKGNGNFLDIQPIIIDEKVELVEPSQGLVLEGGATTTIIWKSPLYSRLVNIEYSTDNGGNWAVINTSSPIQVTQHRLNWLTPLINSDKCIVRITDAATGEELTNSGVFTIKVEPASIVRPAASDPTYAMNAKDNIKWSCKEAIRVYFEFSSDDVNWIKVTDVVDATISSTPWTIPNAATCSGVVRMVNANTGEVVAVSEYFKVSSGSVSFTGPKAATQFNSSQSVTITWTSSQLQEFDLQYSTDGGVNWTLLSKNVKASARKYSWKTPTGINSTNVVVRAINGENECIVYNVSNRFEIGTVGIEEPTNVANIVSITPNPASGDATLNYSAANAGKATIGIYDVHGAKVISLLDNKVVEAGTHTLNFNVANLSNGVYVVRMQIGSITLVKEFVVAK